MLRSRDEHEFTYVYQVRAQSRIKPTLDALRKTRNEREDRYGILDAPVLGADAPLEAALKIAGVEADDEREVG